MTISVDPRSPKVTKFETTLEGGYGYSVGAGQRAGQGAGRCECPMCYHSAHNPCGVCGCPSNSSSNITNSSTKVRNVSQLSGTSDYSSLSPDLHTSTSTASSSSSREGNLDTTQETADTNTDLKEEDLKETQKNHDSTSQRSSSPPSPAQEAGETPAVAPEAETEQSSEHSSDGAEDSDHIDPPCDTAETRDTSAEDEDTTETRDTRVEDTLEPRDTCAEEDAWTRDSRDRFRANPRRHSWAGGRLGGAALPARTSLQDFKRLLAQRTPSLAPARPSAVEQLKGGPRAEPAPATSEPSQSSQAAAATRKTSSVVSRRDARFAAIEEESEAARDEATLS